MVSEITRMLPHAMLVAGAWLMLGSRAAGVVLVLLALWEFYAQLRGVKS